MHWTSFLPTVHFSSRLPHDTQQLLQAGSAGALADAAAYVCRCLCADGTADGEDDDFSGPERQWNAFLEWADACGKILPLDFMAPEREGGCEYDVTLDEVSGRWIKYAKRSACGYTVSWDCRRRGELRTAFQRSPGMSPVNDLMALSTDGDSMAKGVDFSTVAFRFSRDVIENHDFIIGGKTWMACSLVIICRIEVCGWHAVCHADVAVTIATEERLRALLCGLGVELTNAFGRKLQPQLQVPSALPMSREMAELLECGIGWYLGRKMPGPVAMVFGHQLWVGIQAMLFTGMKKRAGEQNERQKTHEDDDDGGDEQVAQHRKHCADGAFSLTR